MLIFVLKRFFDSKDVDASTNNKLIFLTKNNKIKITGQLCDFRIVWQQKQKQNNEGI
jgi:hypothetical protein